MPKNLPDTFPPSRSKTIFFMNKFCTSHPNGVRPFHKTLSESSLQMHLISVRFYEISNIGYIISYFFHKIGKN